MLARYEYDVFEAIRSEVGTSDNVRTFTGKEYDSDVKLHYFVRRYYDPYIGRFTQRDPAGQGVNWYLYTDNNPLARIDPDGQWWETLFDIAGAALSGWEFVKTPNWKTGGAFVLDTGAVFVPFVPGTYASRLAVRVVSKADPAKAFKGVKFKKGNARTNLIRVTGSPPPGYDAHHIIPVAVHKTLAEIGSEINPHSPQYLTWWKSSKAGGTHQNFWKKYNDEWEEFLGGPQQRTDEEILNFAQTMAEKYKSHYLDNKYYFELYMEQSIRSGSPHGYRSRLD